MHLLQEKEKSSGIAHRPVSANETITALQVLYSKIGASNDLPKSTNERISYFNEIWVTMYLRNNLCPGDVPFDIIINKFTEALVHGKAERKGNNMAAIVQCFNRWIVNEKTRQELYIERDRLYPNSKPKQLKSESGINVSDLSVSEIRSRIEGLQPFMSMKSVQDLKETYEKELKRRE